MTQDLAHANLMLRGTVGMQKQNRHGFKAFFADDARHFPSLLLIEGRPNRTVG